MRSRARGLVCLGAFLVVAGVPAGGSFAQRLKVAQDFGSFGEQAIQLESGVAGETTLVMIYGDSVAGIAFFELGSGAKRWEIFGGIDEYNIQPDLQGGEVQVRAVGGGFVLASDNQSQRYLVDSDEDVALANHIWYQNSTTSATDWRMMQLTEMSGGSLLVAGPVTQNSSFDLAEAFWEQQAVEPGELVAVDPERPDAVRPTTAPYQAALLGVASANPGFILGGGSFSLEALERTWGPAVAEAYRRLRPELEQRVFSELPDLAAEAERLSSLSSFEDHLARQRSELEADAALHGGRPSRAAWQAHPQASPESLRLAYEKALAYHQESMFDRTVQRFFKDRFTTVALAGRVPVKVDAAFGAIRPGDYLTSSPIAGVAMKATGPGPVVGTALESLDQGSGRIQVYVHRGWYGGEGLIVAGARPAAASASAEAKDREIAELRSRLAALEARLDRLRPATPVLAGSTGSSVGSTTPSP